ncbi:hypothetical protein BSAF29S_01073 [Bacillus safensis subsp. safensis]
MMTGKIKIRLRLNPFNKVNTKPPAKEIIVSTYDLFVLLYTSMDKIIRMIPNIKERPLNPDNRKCGMLVITPNRSTGSTTDAMMSKPLPKVKIDKDPYNNRINKARCKTIKTFVVSMAGAIFGLPSRRLSVVPVKS